MLIYPNFTLHLYGIQINPDKLIIQIPTAKYPVSSPSFKAPFDDFNIIFLQFYLESVKGGAVVSTPKPSIKTEKTTLYLEKWQSSGLNIKKKNLQIPKLNDIFFYLA